MNVGVKKPFLRAWIYRHPVAIPPRRKQWGSLAFPHGQARAAQETLFVDGLYITEKNQG